MDSDILRLGSGMIIGGFAAAILSSYMPGQVSGDISAIGWLSFLLGALIVALAILEEK